MQEGLRERQAHVASGREAAKEELLLLLLLLLPLLPLLPMHGGVLGRGQSQRGQSYREVPVAKRVGKLTRGAVATTGGAKAPDNLRVGLKLSATASVVHVCRHHAQRDGLVELLKKAAAENIEQRCGRPMAEAYGASDGPSMPRDVSVREQGRRLQRRRRPRRRRRRRRRRRWLRLQQQG